MTFNRKSFFAGVLFALMSINAYAAKTYTEDDFLRSFSGKSNTIVLEKLGNPDKKEQSVKPTGANTMLAGKGQES